MAVVSYFVPMESVPTKRHPTDVECSFGVVESGDARLLQLNTYGSDKRERPNKLSQTIQLDEERAKELVNILKSTFRL